MPFDASADPARQFEAEVRVPAAARSAGRRRSIPTRGQRASRRRRLSTSCVRRGQVIFLVTKYHR
jgi:hypothetical protein